MPTLGGRSTSERRHLHCRRVRSCRGRVRARVECGASPSARDPSAESARSFRCHRLAGSRGVMAEPGIPGCRRSSSLDRRRRERWCVRSRRANRLLRPNRQAHRSTFFRTMPKVRRKEPRGYRRRVLHERFARESGGTRGAMSPEKKLPIPRLERRTADQLRGIERVLRAGAVYVLGIVFAVCMVKSALAPSGSPAPACCGPINAIVTGVAAMTTTTGAP